jgi:hypothetical protein
MNIGRFWNFSNWIVDQVAESVSYTLSTIRNTVVTGRIEGIAAEQTEQTNQQQKKKIKKKRTPAIRITKSAPKKFVTQYTVEAEGNVDLTNFQKKAKKPVVKLLEKSGNIKCTQKWSA